MFPTKFLARAVVSDDRRRELLYPLNSIVILWHIRIG